MRLIMGENETEYFCAKGWTVLGDLPVVLLCRSDLDEIALACEANQSAERRVGKGALAPCPPTNTVFVMGTLPPSLSSYGETSPLAQPAVCPT